MIIYLSSFEQHLIDLETLLQRLTCHSLTCTLDKCHFAQDKLQYRGETRLLRGEGRLGGQCGFTEPTFPAEMASFDEGEK